MRLSTMINKVLHLSSNGSVSYQRQLILFLLFVSHLTLSTVLLNGSLLLHPTILVSCKLELMMLLVSSIREVTRNTSLDGVRVLLLDVVVLVEFLWVLSLLRLVLLRRSSPLILPTPTLVRLSCPKLDKFFSPTHRTRLHRQ